MSNREPELEVINDELIQKSLTAEKYQRKFEIHDYGEIPSLLLSFNCTFSFPDLFSAC